MHIFEFFNLFSTQVSLPQMTSVRTVPSPIWNFQIWLYLCFASCSFHSYCNLLFQLSLSYIVRLKLLYVFYMCLCSLLCALHVCEFGPISCEVIQFIVSKFCAFLMICQSFYVLNIKPLLYISMKISRTTTLDFVISIIQIKNSI